MLLHQVERRERPVRLVVIGATGFIGRHLVEGARARGIDFLALGRNHVDLVAAGASEAMAALLSPDDSVVVLTALTPDKGRGNPILMSNLRMMEAVCTALKKVVPRQIVYMSSDAVYPMGEGMTRESSCAQPPDLYGLMHLVRERMIVDSTKAPVAILRCTLVYGEGDTHNSYGPNRFLRQAHSEGKITLFGAGEETRDHIWVGDVASIILDVVEHRSAGILNIATGTSYSFMEVAKLIAAILSRPVEIVEQPRQAPITHRHYDIAAILKAFPGKTLMPLRAGLTAAFGGLCGVR